MKKNSLYLLALLLFTVTISIVAYTNYELRTEEGLVYKSVFEPNPEFIQFENIVTLSKPSICRSTEVHYKDLPTELVNNFIKANEAGSKPIRLTALEGNVPIVSWEDTKRMHEEETIFTFRPVNKRLLYLSRVGFNKQKTNAIVCIEISENSYGQGVLLFLEKNENKWKVSNSINIWIS